MSYYVFASPTPGAPIDYTTPIAVTAGTSAAVPLAVGANSFGVRAFDGFGDSGFGGGPAGGLGTQFGDGGFAATGYGSGEESNLDCALTITLDAHGNDITFAPAAPVSLRAFATVGGGVLVEWWSPAVRGPKAPQGFHVYVGTPTPNYSAPAATVAASSGVLDRFSASLSGLTGGTTYAVAVRAFNASGEESNTNTVTVTADATGPGAVTGLSATAIV